MKNLTSIFALILFCSCGQQASDNAGQESLTDPKQIIEKYFEYFNAHDWKAMSSMYAEPAEMKDPSYGNSMVSMNRDYIEAKYRELNTMIPDVKDSIVSMLVCDDKVVIEFISKGTIQEVGPFELPICTIFEIKNGMITKDFTYYDLE